MLKDISEKQIRVTQFSFLSSITSSILLFLLSYYFNLFSRINTVTFPERVGAKRLLQANIWDLKYECYGIIGPIRKVNKEIDCELCTNTLVSSQSYKGELDPPLDCQLKLQETFCRIAMSSSILLRFKVGQN